MSTAIGVKYIVHVFLAIIYRILLSLNDKVLWKEII